MNAEVKQQRIVAVVPPRAPHGKVPACKGEGTIITPGVKKPERHKLESWDDVRWFSQGKFMITRKPEPDEDVTNVPENHRRYRNRKKDDTDEGFARLHSSQLVKKKDKKTGIEVIVGTVSGVFKEYVGVKPGDLTASFLGSTGGLILSGLIHMLGSGIGIRALTIFEFIKQFGEEYPDEDRALAIASLLSTPEGQRLFHPVTASDLVFVTMSDKLDEFNATQDARIRHGNRVYSAERSRVFHDPKLFFSELSMEDMAKQAMENDEVHIRLLKKETELKKEVEQLLLQIPIYPAIRGRSKGASVSILGPIIAEALTIKRYDSMAAWRRYMGVGTKNGKFMKMTAGKTLGYNPVCRQAMYQFIQQFVKGNAEDCWNERYLDNRVMYQFRHPNPVLVELVKGTKPEDKEWVESGRRFNMVPDTFVEEKVNGKKQWTFTLEGGTTTVTKGFFLYNPGHIMKMAQWRTVTEWCDWVYWFWRSFEGLESRPPKFFPPQDKEAVEKTATEWYANHPPKVPKGYKPPPAPSTLIQGEPVAKAA